ncbi:D-beta-D-heptose 7-phosphate kinase / D-beta-D-heptose 1-phosphate adenosyltransferase [Phycisphaerales bacterium]|nr:D-beta-D-heptose 7-phosphate kinase / D-beta-D-heptose 1-phosphate adenosyltransferase [Phycisphaerales bacterium]
MDSLLNILATWRPFTALVVGDFMLDQLVYGDAERLSPDAPVPILHVRKTENRPGGAANVCLDLAALRARVLAFGVTGHDPHADTLRRELAAQGIDTQGIIADASRPTTVKQNLIGLAQSRHPQKMFRVDMESREPLAADAMNALVAAFEKSLASADVVCIEDYNKGVCSPDFCRRVIDAARRANKPVFVDPARGTDYAKYKGATTITPNRTEAEEAAGLATDPHNANPNHNAALARTLLDRLDLDACILTLDRHGALVLEKGKAPAAVPTLARNVYDVTGAGDMFLAGLAAARANGANWLDATRFANAAAGLEVEVFGVQPIPLEQIHHSLVLMTSPQHGKLRTLDQALLEAAALRKQGKKIIFTNGCFDVLHSGHVTLLEKAAREGGDSGGGGFLIVGLNDDASVRRLKGESRPVNNQEDRARVLGALASVGAVILFAEDTPMRLIEHLKPDVLVKGADYTKEAVVGGKFVESYGGRVALIELVEGKSTSSTIERMRR